MRPERKRHKANCECADAKGRQKYRAFSLHEADELAHWLAALSLATAVVVVFG